MISRSVPPSSFALLLVMLAAAAAPPPAGPPTTAPAALERFEFVQPKMGTVFRIVLYAPDKATADAAAAAAFKRVDDLNAALSDYDPNSELSRLSQQTNDGPMSRPTQVGDDLWRVLEAGSQAAETSGGAFDVTVGPFTRLWRRSKELRELPAPERIDAARQSFGFRHMRLDPKSHAVQLLAPRMRLDVGGIAKGYTAEQAMAVVRQHGVTRAMVGAAGDIAIGDPPPGRDAWRVGVQSLQKPDEVAGYVNLRNCGISTSGDTYRVVEIDGKRYSHIVDPKTGLGLTHRIGVTVVAPDATTSDWSSTAVSILGPEKGLAMIERIPGAAVRIVVPDGPDDDNGGAGPGGNPTNPTNPTSRPAATTQPSTVLESGRFKALGFEPAASFPKKDERLE